MYKIVVFDLDGTLANTVEDLADAVNFGLENAGLHTYSVEAYKQMVGNGIVNLVKKAIYPNADEEIFDRVKSDFDFYYNAHSIEKTTAYEGTSELLKYLAEKKIMTAVLSNKPDRFVAQILSKLFPNHKFDYEWGKKEEYPIKPNPQSLFAILNKAGIEKSECLYVGDSNVDCQTAQNAGVKCCGVSWGFRGRKELEDAGADIVVDTPMEIIEEFGI